MTVTEIGRLITPRMLPQTFAREPNRPEHNDERKGAGQ